MGLIERIETIRKKPEHIRLRYIWFFVFICMTVVMAIWFFSLKNDLAQNSSEKEWPSQTPSVFVEKSSDIIKEIEKQKSAFQEAQKNTQEDLGELPQE
jgi:hypothetical protein